MIYVMKLKKALAKNIAMLQEITGDSGNAMAKKCKISPKMIGHIKRMEINASVETIERIAEYYRIPAWLLLMDGLTKDSLLNNELDHLIDNYLVSDKDGRKAIDDLADREAFLSKRVENPPTLKSAQDIERSS